MCENLYFDLEKCIPILSDWITSIEREKDTPSFMVKEIKEFFKKPEIYIKRSYAEQLSSLNDKLHKFNSYLLLANPSKEVVEWALENKEALMIDELKLKKGLEFQDDPKLQELIRQAM